MDSSTNGQVKGGPTNKVVNSRPIATRNVKTASPSQSPKTATDSPRPATSRNAGPPSKPASAKATPGAKEASNAKISAVRTAAASPNKPRSVTQKDPASPAKPPGSQITRQQTRDKGTQQSPLLTESKAEAGKKSVEGAQPGKSKAEGRISTPTRQNGAAKKDVGRLTQHGIVPKEKTPCLQPGMSGSGPTKSLASSSSPTKPAKMPLTLNKPAKSVPAPDKPVTTSPLPAAKIKPSSPKLTNATSPITKAVKTASPLAKTPRLTSVPTKASTPTSAVSPMNATSSPAKSTKTTLVKPLTSPSTANQAKLGKQTTVKTKQPSALTKPTNRSSATSKPATVTGKPVNEKRPVPKPVKTGESQQVINPQKLDSSEMNVNVVEVIHAQAEHKDTGPAPDNESKVQENIAESAERLLRDAQSTLEPCTVSTEMPAESCPGDSEMQQSGSLDQCEKSLKDLNNHIKKGEIHSNLAAVRSPSDEDKVTPAEVELSHEALKPSLEPREELLEPVNSLEKGIQSPLRSLQEETSSSPELIQTLKEPMSPSEKEVELREESLQYELSSPPLELSEMLLDKEKVKTPAGVLQEESIPPIEEELETPITPLEQSVTCPVDSDGNFSNKVPTPEELSEKEVPSPVEALHIEETFSSERDIILPEELDDPTQCAHHSKEVEHLERATPHVHEDMAFGEEEGCPRRPVQEDIYSPVEHAELSEEMQTSSLEQVTPLEEGVELSEYEVGFVDEPNATFKEKGSTSLRPSEQSVTLPSDFCKHLEIQLTSSMEEVTPSDEEMELSKADDESLQEKIISSEQLNGEDGKSSTDLNKASEGVMTSSVEADEKLQEETIIAEELEQLSVTLPGESAKPLDEVLQSPAKPADSVEENLTGEITFPEEPVMLADSVTYLEGLEDSREDTQQHKLQLKSESPIEDAETELIKPAKAHEETPIFKPSLANYPVDNSTTEPVGYGSETDSDFGLESDEHFEQGVNRTNRDSERFPGELLIETTKDEAETNSADLKAFDKPANMAHASVKEPAGPLYTETTQLDSAEIETDYMCSPITLEQPGVNSILFPEEPLASVKQSEMALLESDCCLVEAPKTSLEPPNHAEEAMALSICELMGSPGDLVTAARVAAECQAAEITASQFRECPESAEIGQVHSISTSYCLPTHQGNVLLESIEPITIIESAKKAEPPEEDHGVQEPVDTAAIQPLGGSGIFQTFAVQKEPINLITMPMVEQKEPINLITMPMAEQKEPVNLMTMPMVEQKEPVNLITMPMVEQREPINLITMPMVEQKEPINLITMPMVEQKEPINLITMPMVEEKEPINLITMPMVEQMEPNRLMTVPVDEEKEPNDLITVLEKEQEESINLITMPMEEENEPDDLVTVPVEKQEEPISLITIPMIEQKDSINLICMPVEEEKEPNDLICMPMEEEKEPNDLITVPVEEEWVPSDIITMLVEENKEPIDIMTVPVKEEEEPTDVITISVEVENEPTRITVPLEEEIEPIDMTTVPVEEEKEAKDLRRTPAVEQREPIGLIAMPVATQIEKCYPLDQTGETLADLVTNAQEMVEMEPFTQTADSEHLPLISLAETESPEVLHPIEEAWSPSRNNTKLNNSLMANIREPSMPIVLPSDDLQQDKTITADSLSEQTVNPAEAAAITAEPITFSDEGIKGTIHAVSVENQHEVDNKPDLPMLPTEPLDSGATGQKSEKEQWVLVEKEELADFQEETEDKPQRPASLNQEGDNQEEPKVVEEEAGERASVCSTLSDPQLAGKSSSETSTPEELRTYEDSSSGVESHSDDVATSPQTTLTPDPDLGIHMGQEEGSDTPAGTPASKVKGAPHPLQNASLEELSEGTSLSSVIKTPEEKEMAHKMEVTGFTCPPVSPVSREQRCEERAEERGPLRGNDD